MSFKTKPKGAAKASHKTKQDALAAARKARGANAVEGVDFQLRNIGTGWVHEDMPEPVKKVRAKRAPKVDLTDPDNPEWTAETFARAKPASAMPAAMRKAFPKTKDAGTNKTDLVVAMLKAQAGATSKAMEEVTGWKAPSVRGLLGTLKKRGVTVTATKVQGSPTVYRIEAVGEVI